MRKKELIQIHALLLEVAQHLIENENMPAERITAYCALNVSPSCIHKSKQDHYEAIAVLGNSIEWWIEHSDSTILEHPMN